MSRFFIGQPVKKARGYLAGLTGRVAVIDPSDPRGFGFDADLPGVGVDGDPFPAGRTVFCYPDEVEPILPSGQVAVTLEQLLSVPGLESLENIFGAKA